MPSDDVLLLVEATLTEEARESWLRRAFEMYPRLRGAKVADVLADLNSTDSHLPLVEPWWATHGQRLATDLLCEPALLSGAVRLAIVATGASNQVPFDALAEAVARAAVAGEQGVISLENVQDAPDDGLYHGREFDVAMALGGGPEGMGVCLSTLSSRREQHVEEQMDEATFATSVLIGDEVEIRRATDEEARDVLLELKRALEEAKGEEMTREEATVLALRTVIGGSFSRGIEVGLNLARNRQAKQPMWELQEYDSGADVMTGPGDVKPGSYELIERGKI